MQISFCENSDAGGRIVSDKATAPAPRANIGRTARRGLPLILGNARGNRRKKINEPRRAGRFNRDTTRAVLLSRSARTITKIVARSCAPASARAKRGEICPYGSAITQFKGTGMNKAPIRRE